VKDMTIILFCCQNLVEPSLNAHDHVHSSTTLKRQEEVSIVIDVVKDKSYAV